MKMAKASESDLDMALNLIGVLDDIEKGYFPHHFDPESESIEWLDTQDRQQYDKLIDNLRRLLNRGSIGRVIMGMAVVCDPSNECIDPDADTIEHHPKRQQLEKQRDELLARLDVVCDVQIVSQTYSRIRSEQIFAIDDIEYDLFASGWKAAIAAVKGGAA